MEVFNSECVKILLTKMINKMPDSQANWSMFCYQMLDLQAASFETILELQVMWGIET